MAFLRYAVVPPPPGARRSEKQQLVETQDPRFIGTL
jgi:hypothetical protein